MRYTSAFLLIAVAAAQSISDIPSCAVSCLANGVQRVNCGLTDFRCSCQKSTQLTQILTPCVQQSCPSVTDQQKVVTVLAGICQQAGVPVTVPTVTGGASSVPVYTSAPLAGSSQSRGGGGGASTALTSASISRNATSTASRATSTASAPDNGGDGSCGDATVTVTATVPQGAAGTTSVISRNTTVPGMQTSNRPFPTSATSRIPSGGASGTGVASGTRVSSSLPPSFTGSGAAIKVPLFAGMFGLAAAVM